MKWLDAGQIDAWSHRVDARTRLSEVVAQLVRASAAGIAEYDFPTGDSAQRPGFDGRLTATPAKGFEQFLPAGFSVWEYGTSEDFLKKANEDYKTRTDNLGPTVNPAETTLVIVTGRRWNLQKPTLAEWVAEKRAEGHWKDVLGYDAIALEAWLDLCPAVAASIARDVLGNLPQTGAISPEEFWNEYASQFQPHLKEEVLVAGRKEQAEALLRELAAGPQVVRWQGDSLAEVLAFMVASIRLAPEKDRKFLESRVLLLETKEAARSMNGKKNLIFSVSGDATQMAGQLGNSHAVLVPLGRDSIRDHGATRLNRPSGYEMSESLKSMGLNEDECRRLALECDRSVTILARRIPIAGARRPSWYKETALIPALFAGAWDTSVPGDLPIVARLAGVDDYAKFEAAVRQYREAEDAPLESVDTVWAVRAPVDVFVNLANLLGPEYFAALRQVVEDVFSRINPALDLAVDDRPFARMRGANLPHSPWLREGLANTLLMIAVIGEKSGLVINGTSPQHYVNEVIANIPALRDNHRVIASLSHELPLLMEAAPDPLLSALEHLLEGDGGELFPIFQDSKAHSSIFTSSPHTNLLWALELIAWDPDRLLRASTILARLAAIDPGGALANRPARSLRHIFLAWHPGTNATLQQRLTTIDRLIEQNESIAWNLLTNLLPKGFDSGDTGPRPQFREAGASDREVVTQGLLYKSYDEIIRRAVALAGTSANRWASLLDTIHTFSDPQKHLTIDRLSVEIDRMSASERTELWEKLAKVIRHHRAWPAANWSLHEDVLSQLEAVLARLEPTDPLQQSLWLFEESFPLIEHKEGKDFLAEAERLRKEAIADLINARGPLASLDLAEQAKAPRFIGLAVGQVIPTTAELVNIAKAAFARGAKFDSFVSLLSAAGLDRFGDAWRNAIVEWNQQEKLTDDQIVILVLGWPHERSTWRYVEEFGESAAASYWKSRTAWGIRGDKADLGFAVEQYLAVNRAEAIVLELFTRFKEIDGHLLLATLDQFDQRIGEEPRLIEAQNLYFYLEQLFIALREGGDVTSAEIALREYRYLSLLRESRVFSRDSHALELDKFMAESPEFYVRILSDVYGPASDRGKQKEVTERDRARAHIGWTLLEGFVSIPGRADDQIDGDQLNAWVAEVRRLAEESDRLRIGEEKIGALLAHAPEDPADKLWPHSVVRCCLEEWSSDSIEHGMLLERINMRGVTRRLPKDGGQQERDLAESARAAAKAMDAWPRIQKLLRSLAMHWDEVGKREDIRAAQMEMRE
ncbi:MAG: hypothetical protein JRN15_09510 [Nitrososphaerota archaeon]|nr:hypothetical protein [Nitrososphaerota archaeon]